MNFLLEFSGVKYNVWHCIAKHLKQLYPGSRFFAITGSHSVRRFLEEQKEVSYELILDLNEIERQALLEEIDYEELRKFEERMSEKSLWRFIAMDRKWGRAFIKNSVFVGYDIEINHENILRIVYGYIKTYKFILKKLQIDVVLPASGMHSMSVPIMEQICKNENIAYLLPVETRVLNYFAISSNKELIFPQINRAYEEFIKKGNLCEEFLMGEECFKRMETVLSNPNVWYKTTTSDLKPSFRRTRFITKSLKGVLIESVLWIKSQVFNSKVQPVTISRYLGKVFYQVLLNYQRMNFSNPKYFDNFDILQKYVYYPLQVSPEYIVQIAANIWADQLLIIDVLSKSIPHDWKVYVKEHPGTKRYRVRPRSFYSEIRKYPNVKIVPISTNTFEIIRNAQLIVTLASTTGLEALMCGKPVISFIPDIYTVTGLSKTCNNFADLSKDIYEVMRTSSEISKEEKRRRLIFLFSAIIHNGFWVEEPYIFTGDQPSELEEKVDEASRKTAYAIENFLNQYKNNTYLNT